VKTGSWGNVATAAQLDSVADALPSALGGGAFIPFWPERLTAAIPPAFGPLLPELPPFGSAGRP
jgi:hypothetical protein